MNAVIRQVFPEPRLWNKPEYPDSCSVQGLFEDGSRFELATKTNKASEHIAALQALVGKPGDFDLEEKPEYQGQRQFKMKSYPGKPDKGFGGGGRSYTPAWAQTEEGERYTQERMDRRTSLMQAVEWGKQQEVETDAMLMCFHDFYDLLRSTEQKPRNGTQEPRRQEAGVQGGGNPSEVWDGPGQCPTCHAPAGKRHGKQCLEA